MTPGTRVRIEATVHGMVQEVGFRYWTRRQAHGLGLVGTVGNRDDGTVHVIAEGEPDAIDRFVRWLHRGPSSSRVERVEVVRAPPVGDLTTFEIVSG
jgi:acylphosphatase